MVEGNDNHTNEPDSGSGTPKRRGGLFGARRVASVFRNRNQVRSCGCRCLPPSLVHSYDGVDGRAIRSVLVSSGLAPCAEPPILLTAATGWLPVSPRLAVRLTACSDALHP